MKTAKKSLSVLLSLLMLLSVFAGMTFTANAANTYEISTYAELKAFADAVNGGERNANAVLTADIIAEDTDWTPIGDLYNAWFMGTFNGDGHTITGLSTESSPNRKYVGLFGYIDESGVVMNVGMIDGNIMGMDFVGAVVGYNEGKIINCYNTGKVTTAENDVYTGGVVGFNKQGTVQNCYNTGTVSGVKAIAGGVVGGNYSNHTNKKSIVANCYNTGDVTGVIVGGVAGENLTYAGDIAEISSCFNTGKISGTIKAGGVTGENQADTDDTPSTATITNCYNTGAVYVNGSYARAGGVVGLNYAAEDGCTASVNNCYSAGIVTAEGSHATAGGVIGENNDGTVQNCYYDGDVCTANNGIGTKLTTAQMTVGTYTGGVAANMPGFSSENWLVRPADEFYSYYPHLKGFDLDASGNQLAAESIRKSDWPARKVKDGVMEISNYAELQAFSTAVNGGSATLNGILTADIIAEGTDWMPIGNESKWYEGTFDGDRHTITGLSTESNANRNYAGLFGFVEETGVVQNVGLIDGSIKGMDCVGAVAGDSCGKIINCYNTGKVTTAYDNAHVGGVVGYNQYGGTVQNCYNTGEVTSTGNNSFAGGVVGYNYIGTVQSCYNTGKITATGEASYVGGVVGENYHSTVHNCYNTGDVSGYYVGGVAGENDAGGSRAEISNCFNMGKISGTGLAGGVVVFNNSVVGYCYYDSDVFTVNNNIGTALTTAQMTGMDALSNMPGFATDKWLQRANIETAETITCFYPHLQGFAYDTTGAVEDWPAVRIVLTELGKAKADAKAELENYIAAIDPADYRLAQQTDLANAIAAGNTAIDEAADIDAVEAALEGAKAAIDAIKTDAQLTAEEQLASEKTGAKQALIDYVNSADYRAAEQADLSDAITAGNAAIDAAADTDAVATALANAKAAIDAIPTDAQLTAQEAAAAALAAAKDMLASDIESARDYYDSIKDEYPEIADDLDTKLQVAEAILGDVESTIGDIVPMIELVEASVAAAKEAVAAAEEVQGDGFVCPFCGEIHENNNIFEEIIAFIHYLYYFISVIVRTFD